MAIQRRSTAEFFIRGMLIVVAILYLFCATSALADVVIYSKTRSASIYIATSFAGVQSTAIETENSTHHNDYAELSPTIKKRIMYIFLA